MTKKSQTYVFNVNFCKWTRLCFNEIYYARGCFEAANKTKNKIIEIEKEKY